MKITACSACTHDHDDIDPEKMDEPFNVNGEKFTHHFFCPDNGIEVVIRFEKKTIIDVEQRAIYG